MALSSRIIVRVTLVAGLLGYCASPAVAEDRPESFDADPGWDAYHNRSTAFEPKTIVQRFGYSPTRHAGGERPGEIGGLINPAAEPAYYAKKIPLANLDDALTASGTLACTGERPVHALIGFFNTRTLNEWRTPNTIAIRIQGRGEVFFAYVEYATSRWRAGGDSPGGFPTIIDPHTGRPQLQGFAANGKVHHWTITYDPNANQGSGSIAATIDGQRAVCHLDSGHKSDGATFDRFGLLPVLKQWDDPGELWLDDISVNGEFEDFSSDPGWDATGNRRTYVSTNVRPRFDFGYSPTHFAGGKDAGELGGLVFRGDIREPQRMAYYGDRLEELTLARPLRASGTVALRRAVSDSTSLIGFFNAQESIRTTESQATGIPHCFLGLAVEGPSREGFFVYPVCHTSGSAHTATGDDLPRILPDGSIHRWTIEYFPDGTKGGGQVTATLDGKPVRLHLPPDTGGLPSRFDRFGIVSTWIDGNGQHIYFDDLTYTGRH